jgi:hypothetical protein
MPERKDDVAVERILAFLERNWKLVILGSWLLFAAWFLYSRWTQIHVFGLSDTDDNMRMMQVRALFDGQGWFDLRQYRLNAPLGANMHWTRLVDLPLAGIILALRPFVGGPDAERVAAAVAPILPYLVLLFGLALTARRLIDPRAFILPVVAMILASMANNMFMPTRIDHHGWQLAFLSLSIAGLVDPKRIRGGLTLGISTALSLAIGLEMMVYLAIAGAAVALFWVVDAAERPRAITYALTVGGSVALSFLVFASYDNRLAVCDALSPVWLSNILLASALLLLLAIVTPADWRLRLALGAGAAAIVAVFHVVAWPHCVTRLEGVSQEVYDLWLSKVREARPLLAHGWRTFVLVGTLPVTGLAGWALLAWRNRLDADLFRRTIAAGMPALVALLLLCWQTRTGPHAQVLAAVGAVSVIWILAPMFGRIRNPVIQAVALAAAALISFGAVVPLGLKLAPSQKATERQAQINRANRLCNFIGSYRPIAELPKGTVFSFVDHAPRLITLTHHNAIIGPYHRNGEQIADVMNAFRGDPGQARAIFEKYDADYLLTCPNSSTTTIFLAEASDGFYGQLSRDQVPDWLDPVELPEDSPFRMWRIERSNSR